MSDKKPASTSSKGNEAPIGAQVEKGTVAETRRAALVEPSALWAPPGDYRPLDKPSIAAMSKIAESQEAEFEAAVRQLIEQGPTLRTRFGELAPDTSATADLWRRYKTALDDFAIAERQMAYFGDIYQTALHDLLQGIALVDDTVRPASTRHAQVAADFSAVLKISDQRGEAVREGHARKRAAKASSDNESDGEPAPKDPTPPR